MTWLCVGLCMALGLSWLLVARLARGKAINVAERDEARRWAEDEKTGRALARQQLAHAQDGRALAAQQLAHMQLEVAKLRAEQAGQAAQAMALADRHWADRVAALRAEVAGLQGSRRDALRALGGVDAAEVGPPSKSADELFVEGMVALRGKQKEDE